MNALTGPQVFCILYLVQRVSHEYADYSGLHNLYDWLVSPEENEILRTWPSVEFPDICGRCFHIFGNTIGGRLRDGCYLCKAQCDTHIWEIGIILRDFHISREHFEAVFATALAIFATHRIQS